ncbi:MAG: class I SAM-dependent methyltransferase [Thermomicrobiales bacterium]
MQRPGWFPNELAHAGAEHLDPAYVAIYDRKSATDPTEDLTLLRALGLDESSVVVDLGAGTGTFALAVAPLCRRIVAVDVSPAMLATASAQAERLGLTNLEVVHSGFLTYAHQGDRADFVYSRNALHHLPDFWKALALERVADMLRPGGVLRLHDLVFSFDPNEAEHTIEAWLRGARERPEDGWTRAELETHVREEYSTFSWLLEPMLEHAGFDIREAIYRPSRTYAAYTCVKR